MTPALCRVTLLPVMVIAVPSKPSRADAPAPLLTVAVRLSLVLENGASPLAAVEQVTVVLPSGRTQSACTPVAANMAANSRDTCAGQAFGPRTQALWKKSIYSLPPGRGFPP